MKKTLLQIIILLFLVSCDQKEKTDFETGILWRIESKNEIESFIFGTVHLYPRTEMEFPKNVISKLQSCKVLALERDITNQSEQQKFADFEMPSFLLESYGVIIEEYGDELVSMESELIKNALESNMELSGLESTNEILSILKTVADIKIPENTFIKEQMLTDYQESLNQYKTQSIKKFHKSMTVQMGDEITKTLVDKRNNNWMSDIEYLIEKERTFIAVGMGHLGGENGILNLLSEKGYKLQRVE
ncbi:TraB/GumN family protein [Seonamhaeicola algicola]|uniref:TraB/GumN family protein n=1 Tax=Seonamhaeicola algicola TaxID=1719036 RepID=A0A5C7AHC9_9FLAO|nr:TraB/GumN family protein [Seonamhaeicola algicola]TXE08120.1 TraB/GumN family protein [Seonamhaeicola algicola]